MYAMKMETRISETYLCVCQKNVFMSSWSNYILTSYLNPSGQFIMGETYVDFFITKSYIYTEINMFSAWYTWDLYDATAFVSDYII